MRGFLSIIWRELQYLYTSRSGFLLLIATPIVVYFLLNSLYGKGSINDLPIAVYDQDHSELSRTLTRFLEASPYLSVAQQLTSEEDMQKAFQSGKVQGIVYIPHNLEKEVLRSRSQKVVIYTNSSNIVFGNLIYKAGSEIVLTTSAGILIKKMQAQGLTEKQSLELFQPMRLSFKPLYNPSYNYLFYLGPGLMTVLMQMFIMFVAVRAFNREFNTGGIAEMISMAKGSVFKMLFGKYIAQLIAFSIFALMVFGIFFPFFNIPLKAELWPMVLLLFVFISASILLGFAVSTMFLDEMFAMDVVLFYNSPAFVFSGFTFPLLGMPWYSKFYAGIIPYTHFLYGFFKIEIMQTPLKYAVNEIIILIIFALIGLLVSFPVLSIQLKNYTKRQEANI